MSSTKFINIRRYFSKAWKNIVRKCAKNPPNFMPYDVSNKNPHAFVTIPTKTPIFDLFKFDDFCKYVTYSGFKFDDFCKYVTYSELKNKANTTNIHDAWKLLADCMGCFAIDKHAFIDNHIARLLLALIYEHYQNLCWQPDMINDMRCVEHIFCNNYLVKNIMKY